MDLSEDDFIEPMEFKVLPYQIIGPTVIGIIILLTLYLYCTDSFDFFARKGIKYLKPKILLGNLGSRLKSKKSFHDFQLEIYNKLKDMPYGGVFEGRRPVLYVFDPELIKDITVRDSKYFMDRTTLGSREPRYLTRSLHNLKGNEWKAVRNTLTAAFDLACIKDMFPLLQSCTDRLVQDLSPYSTKVFESNRTMDLSEDDFIEPMEFKVLPYQIIGPTVIGIIILLTLYLYCTDSFDFFARKGIKYLKPKILLGNLGSRLKSKKSFHDFQLEIYNKLKDMPYGGVFEGRRPVLYVFDPELIKDITVRDSKYFMDRTTLGSREPRYLTRSLHNLKGNEWKAVRNTLTAAFDLACIKDMFPLLQSCTDRLVQDLSPYNNQDIQMQDIMENFTLQVIGSSAFGYSVSDYENAHFVNEAKRYRTLTKTKKAVLFFLLVFVPFLVKYLNVSFINYETSEELIRMLKVAKSKRRNSEIRQCDFLQLFIEAADKEKLNKETKEAGTCLDEATIDAQCLLFIIDGYETSSTLLIFAIHVLATNPDIQIKLRSSIEAATRGQEINYELLSQLTYLEAFVLETLRMYPPVSRIDRVCTREYTLPGTSIKFDVGDSFAIPVYGIHMDPVHYPQPQTFRPERFMNEENKARPPHLFLAFGAGPRNCIGFRFVILMTKLTMVALLKNYKFSVCPETKDPIIFERRGVLLQADGGVMVHIEEL